MTRLLLLLSLMVTLLACGQGNERLVEKARLETEVGSANQVKAENENLARRTALIEQDLEKRHRFYQAIKGVYEGTFETDKGTYGIHLTLVPSLPHYTAGRIRLPEEVVWEISNLYLKVEVQTWNLSDPKTAVGCRFENIRPDMTRGEINLISQDCLRTFRFNAAKSANTPKGDAEGMEMVSDLKGVMRPSTNAIDYEFNARRIKQ